MKRTGKQTFKPIDQKEKDLMKSIERDDWWPDKNIGQKKDMIRAIEANMPDQTLISSLVHKYLNGSLT